MKKESKKEILKRINYAIGHLQGNKKMIEENKYCVDVIRQNQAVIAALNKVNKIILESHLETCVAPAIESNIKSKRQKVFNEISEIFEMEQKLQKGDDK
ncbi:MAG TPA: metal-sensitive transcriptional regulator [Candidatus Nanoarchaeia archaeon]